MHGPVRADSRFANSAVHAAVAHNDWPEGRVQAGSATFPVLPAPSLPAENVTKALVQAIVAGSDKSLVPLGLLNDGKTLACMTDHGVTLKVLPSGTTLRSFSWPPEPTTFRTELSTDKLGVYVSRVGTEINRVLVAGKTVDRFVSLGGIELWDLNSGKRSPFFLQGTHRSIFQFAVSPASPHLVASERAFSGDGVNVTWPLILWDLEKQRGKTLDEGDCYPQFSKDGRWLAYGRNPLRKQTEVVLWDLPVDRRYVLSPLTVGFFVEQPTFSHDGQYVAACLYGLETRPSEIRIWKTSSRELIGRRAANTKNLSVNSPVFSPTGYLLTFTEGEERLVVVDASKPAVVFDQALLEKAGLRNSPTFSPGGRRLAVIGQYRPVDVPLDRSGASYEQPRVYSVDVDNPARREALVLPSCRPTQLLWAPDGRTLIVRAADRLLVLDLQAKR